MVDEVKVCPDCAEQVLTEAKVCKHCGYRFEGSGKAPIDGKRNISLPVAAVVLVLVLVITVVGANLLMDKSDRDGDRKARQYVCDVQREQGLPEDAC